MFPFLSYQYSVSVVSHHSVYNPLNQDRVVPGQGKGFEVWVYTSSFRSEQYIRALFQRYGVKIDQIVNGQRHEKEVQRGRKTRLPQKMPNFYHISLHVDDEKSIEKSGRMYGFRTFRVFEPDSGWAKKVLDEALRVRRIEEKNDEDRD